MDPSPAQSKGSRLMRYLRWRLSCIAGELLIIDHSLLRGAEAEDLVMPFLKELDRPIRALTKSIDPSVDSQVITGSTIEADCCRTARKPLTTASGSSAAPAS